MTLKLQQFAIVFAVLTSMFYVVENVMAAAGDCGDPFVNGYGPYDYTNPEHFREKLGIVNSHHFTKHVQDGAYRIGPDSQRMPTINVIDNLDYTLRAFPNHHPALMAMGDFMLYLRQNPNTHNFYRNVTGPNSRFRTIECYFERAIKFKPSDASVYQIFGIILAKDNDNLGAVEQFDIALQIDPDNAEIHYHIGLSYLKLKNYEKAMFHANKAYKLGYPLPYLKDELKRLGKWTNQK